MDVDRLVGAHRDLAGDHRLDESPGAHRVAGRGDGGEVVLDGARFDRVARRGRSSAARWLPNRAGGRRRSAAGRASSRSAPTTVIASGPSAVLRTTTSGTSSSHAEPGRNGTTPSGDGPVPTRRSNRVRWPASQARGLVERRARGGASPRDPDTVAHEQVAVAAGDVVEVEAPSPVERVELDGRDMSAAVRYQHRRCRAAAG